jgi:hypothetical protein
MTDEKVKELTESHAEALRRLEEHECRRKKDRRWLLTAVFTAIAGVGGGSTNAYFSWDEQDDVKTVIAAELASLHTWQDAAVDDIKALQEHQQQIREAVVRVQTILENLPRGRPRNHPTLDDVEKLLERRLPQPPRAASATIPEQDQIDELKTQLFE